MSIKTAQCKNIKAAMYGSLISAMSIVALSGCASMGDSQAIMPKYVSPNLYQAYDCTLLTQEYDRVVTHIDRVNNQSMGLAASGVSIGIAGNNNGIYPTFNVNLATNANNRLNKQKKLATLYGEHDAMIQAAKLKGCDFIQNPNVKSYGNMQSSDNTQNIQDKSN